MNRALYTSVKDDWETPDDLFKELHHICKFTVDVAASSHNHKIPRYYTQETDGLKQSWAGETVWCNPPYGREISKWLQKACLERDDARIVMLVPARTDTRWWHEYAFLADYTSFLRGRLRFKGAKHSAPFPSALLYYGLEVAL